MRGGLALQTSDARPVVHVVDDDDSFRVAIRRLLSASGFEVRDYPSVAELLRADPESGPGCVVADLQMPGESGRDLQAKLRASGRGLPIVFLTAYGDVPIAVSAMRDGAVDFLTKPVRRAELVAAVDRALARDAEAARRRADLEALRARYATLTKREREVFALIVAGRLNKQIAGALGVVEQTVKAHRAAIKEKLGADSVAALVRNAEALGVEPGGTG